MAREQDQRQIGETIYRVMQMPGPKGQRLLVHLFKLVGPSLAELMRGADSAKENGGGGDGGVINMLDIDLGFVANAGMELAERIPEDEIEKLVDQLAKYTEFSVDEGERWLQLKDQKDAHFAGNYREMFGWLAFTLEHNYKDFFGGTEGLRDVLESLTAEKEPPSNSRKDSTGRSTKSRRASVTRQAS